MHAFSRVTAPICLNFQHPTQMCTLNSRKEELFGNVQTEIDNIKINKEVIVMGDLNGQVGTTKTGYEQAIGHQGIGECRR